MQYITSTRSKKDYIATVKAQLDPLCHFRQERFTGFFIGGFFSVTHHCEYSWFHRITSQMNSAIGFVSRSEDGCKIRFIKTKGILHPIRFLAFLACVIWMPITANFHWWITALFALTTLVIALISTFIESLTDGSIEGENALWALLLHPENPYAHLYGHDQ